MLLLALLAACDGGADSADACATVPYEVTWANFGDGFFGSYCRGCHSVATPSRYGAPDAVNFDGIEEVRQWEERIRVTVLEDQSMPIGGGVYDQDLEFLGYFLDCGL